jgi:hypothetical protein
MARKRNCFRPGNWNQIRSFAQFNLQDDYKFAKITFKIHYMNKLINIFQIAVLLISLLIAIGYLNSLRVYADDATNKPSLAQGQAEDILVNSSIIDLQKLGFTEETILQKIKTSKCNFDTSINALKQLKAANVPERVIQAMMSGVPANSVGESAPATPVALGDSNDPNTPREPGVWLAQTQDGHLKMTQIQPISSAQASTGGGPFGGAMRDYYEGIHAATQFNARKPEFYFYFGAQGSTPLLGANSPTELVLVKFTIKQTKTHSQRVLVVGSIAPFAGVSQGVDPKALVGFDVTKTAPSVYKVVPKGDLSDGEYGFLNPRGGGLLGGNGSSVFDFGISAK